MGALLALALWTLSLLNSSCEVVKMDHPNFPPMSATADEKIASDHTAFRNCEEAVQAFATQGKGQVTDRQYSVSPEWGNVLRAKVALGAGLASAIPVVCWSKPGQDAELVVDTQGPGL